METQWIGQRHHFSDLETSDKRKLRKTKEKNIKFNIKRNNKNLKKKINKNDMIKWITKKKKKTIEKKRVKNY